MLHLRAGLVRIAHILLEDFPIDLTLIPFGLRKDDGIFVDVSHVEKGLKCDCICPSCETPLIARQGEVNQWHFAHASRSVYDQTGKACEYSFFVSVRLMARQVIGDSLEIKLPAYEDTASLDVKETGDRLTEKFIVTNEKIVKIENVEIEKQVFGVPVDVYGNVNGYPFVLYFTHPGRDIPFQFKSLEAEKFGVVEISLENTYSLFISDDNKGQSYLEKLRLFLAEDEGSKNWLYHPRYRKMHEQTLVTLEERRKELLQRLNEERSSKFDIGLYPDSDSPAQTEGEYKRRKVKYHCVMCNVTWVGVEPGYNPCPNCKKHLYANYIE